MGWLADLLKDIPVSAVLKERIALAEDKIKNLEECNEKLTKDNEVLLGKNSDLLCKIERLKKEESFIEDSGVLFKIKSDGNFEHFAYCPKCKQAMSEFPPRSNEMLICAPCTYTAPFAPKELNLIRARVAQEYYRKQKEK